LRSELGGEASPERRRTPLRKTGRSVPKYPAKPSKRAPGETSLIGVGKPSSESGGPDFKVLIRDEAQGTIAECKPLTKISLFELQTL
jgi:hypothetical protein